LEVGGGDQSLRPGRTDGGGGLLGQARQIQIKAFGKGLGEIGVKLKDVGFQVLAVDGRRLPADDGRGQGRQSDQDQRDLREKPEFHPSVLDEEAGFVNPFRC
jgi:hypothetical protein